MNVIEPYPLESMDVEPYPMKSMEIEPYPMEAKIDVIDEETEQNKKTCSTGCSPKFIFWKVLFTLLVIGLIVWLGFTLYFIFNGSLTQIK